jgi:hypothetical protein
VIILSSKSIKMETNQTLPINRGYIELSGRNLKWIGYLIFVNIIITVLIFYLISEKESEISLFNIGQTSKEIKTLIRTWEILSLILIIVKGILFIESGKNLIKSITLIVKSNPNVERTDLIEGGVTLETEYFSNGNIKIEKTFNKDGLKHGIWEYYKEDGNLDFKEVFDNGKFIRKIY